MSPVLKSGNTWADFHLDGIIPSFRDRLNKVQSGPKILRLVFFKSVCDTKSGPTALLLSRVEMISSMSVLRMCILSMNDSVDLHEIFNDFPVTFTVSYR